MFFNVFTTIPFELIDFRSRHDLVGFLSSRDYWLEWYNFVLQTNVKAVEGEVRSVLDEPCSFLTQYIQNFI